MANALDWKAAPRIVYAKEAFPDSCERTIFLAGPTPRGEGDGWRQDAIDLFRSKGYDGDLYSPEPRDGKWGGDYIDQVEWEDEGLHRADCILFWVPRDMKGDKFFGTDDDPQPMPALTTNDEWGFWKDSGKVVWGRPGGADSVRYQEHYAKLFGVSNGVTFEQTVDRALEMVGEGARREGGATQVPLYIWKKPEFQAWYKALKAAGNRLDGCRVSWAFRVPPPAFDPPGPPKGLFLYALHVNVHIGSENRNKTNEIVLFRPDISAVIMWAKGSPWTESQIVIVKEFRVPVRNEAGFVYELPGGSSAKVGEDPRTVAAHEVEEETGLKIDPERLIWHKSRQLASTLSAHVSTVFSVSLTQEELAQLDADTGTHGVEADTERTYVEVWPVSKIFENQLLDWSCLGMILSVIDES